MLSPDQASEVPIMTPYPLAREVSRAVNDWCIDRCLADRDHNLHALIVIASQVPTDAAVEIRRAGSHPGMVGISMGVNGLGLGFGHPVYHPIYEAAEEFGLPVVIQAASEAYPNTYTQTAAGGPHDIP